MLKQRFTFFLIGTILEAWLFSTALFGGYIFLASFWGFLLIRKLITSYQSDKSLRNSGLI